MRHLEDFTPGEVIDLGQRTLTEDEIVAFATEYDPQPFHVDPDAAAGTVFGGLVASGWQTAGVFMRLYVDAVLLDAASLGSPGIEQLRWRKPVRPGTTLHGRVTIGEVTPSASSPERGTVMLHSELVDDEGDVVFQMLGRGLFARRDVDAPPG